MSVELGKRLENLRESKGWNKTYVSKKIGLKTMQTYANYKVNPSISTGYIITSSQTVL